MRFLILAAAVIASAAPTFAQNFFPLQVGNQWLFRGSRFGQTLQVEVTDARKFDGNEYFAVTGFGSERRWLRHADDGSLVEFDLNTNSIRPFLNFQFPEGLRFATSLNDCTKTALIESRQARVKTPATGDRADALQVRYVDSPCADAGVEADFFLAGVGPVKHVETSFAGMVTYELVYARVGDFLTLSQPETSFSVSTPSPIFSNSPIVARLNIRNGGSEPLRLEFDSGQIYNLVLSDADGNVVYNWMAGRLFIAVLQSITVTTEKNWLVDFTPPGPMKPGRYTLEAYLTTSGTPERPYTAKVAVEVVEARVPQPEQ